MAYEGLEYTITNERDASDNIIVLVDRSNYDDIDENEDSYTYDWRADMQNLGEHIKGIAQRAIENPIYLNGPHTDEVYVIHGWGTMDELQKLADGEFVIDLEPAS
jgi:hypothetical protein